MILQVFRQECEQSGRAVAFSLSFLVTNVNILLNESAYEENGREKKKEEREIERRRRRKTRTSVSLFDTIVLSHSPICRRI